MSLPELSAEPAALGYFPIFLALAGMPVLLVGGGEEAAAKLRLLHRAGANVTVVAERVLPALAGLIEAGAASRIDAPFAAAQLQGMRLVFVALDDADAAGHVVEAARAAGILVNAVDRTALCDFIVPAIVDRGELTVAISTAGGAPALARDLRSRVEAAIPPAYGDLVGFCRRWRGDVAAGLPDRDRRRRFWDAVIDCPEAGAVMAGDNGLADRLLAERLARTMADRELRSGRVSLVGAGPGDPDLLTLAAVRAIQRADVILYDKLVNPAILDRARRDARRIDVGKRCGRQPMNQAAINRLILEQARAGAHVVRLKGGDPFIFGRGGEELACLRQAGVPVEVVPGITAACAAAARLGIPLTHRDAARTLHFVTGHGRDGAEVDLDWPTLARPDATVAIYMGSRRLDGLAGKMMAAGLSPDTPALAVENATRAEERVVQGTVGEIARLVADAGFDGPVLVLVGKVVGLRLAETVAAERAA